MTKTFNFFFVGSKAIFQSSNIVAIVMEWIFKAHQWNHVHPPCPEEKVEELAKFLIKNKYEPFGWGIKENTIIKQNKYNHGKNWHYDNLIWLHQPSLPSELKRNHTIHLNLKFG